MESQIARDITKTYYPPHKTFYTRNKYILLSHWAKESDRQPKLHRLVKKALFTFSNLW